MSPWARVRVDAERGSAHDDDAGYAVAAWREEGRWSVALLPPRATESLDSLLMALRQLIADGGALGFLVVDEDFFVAVRMMPDALRACCYPMWVLPWSSRWPRRSRTMLEADSTRG